MGILLHVEQHLSQILQDYIPIGHHKEFPIQVGMIHGN